MTSTFRMTALAAAALLGSTLVAAAQSQPAPGASSEGNVGPGATPSPGMTDNGSGMAPMHRHTSKHHAAMKSNTSKGTTTGSGMKSHHPKGDATKGDTSGEGNVGPGTSNNRTMGGSSQ